MLFRVFCAKEDAHILMKSVINICVIDVAKLMLHQCLVGFKIERDLKGPDSRKRFSEEQFVFVALTNGSYTGTIV